MSLTVKPSLSARYLFTESYVGPLPSGNEMNVFIRTPVSKERSYVTSRGFIETKKSLWVPGSHDCNNLQLDGTIWDDSFLNFNEGYFHYDDLGITVPKLRTADGRSCRPMTLVSSYGYPAFLPYTSVYGGKWILCSVVASNGSYSNWRYYAGGGPATGVASIPRTLPDYIGPTSYYYYAKSVSIPLSGLTADEEGAVAFAAKVLQSLESVWWSGLKRQSAQGCRYSDISSSYDPSANPFSHSYEDKVEEWLSSLREFSEQDVDFGELHYRALCKIDAFSGNGLAYLNDVRNIFKDIKTLLETLSGRPSPKALADLYLSFKYGFSNSYRDTKTLLELAKSSPKSSGVSATDIKAISNYTLKTVSTIRYDPIDNVMEDVISFLRYWDLLPTPDNLWDLIPFSFVVDWLVPVGNILERLDKSDLISHLNVRAVYDSYTFTALYPASRLSPTFSGTISIRRYVRKCGWDASFPLIVTQQPSLVSHWLDGSALIIQRLR